MEIDSDLKKELRMNIDGWFQGLIFINEYGLVVHSCQTMPTAKPLPVAVGGCGMEGCSEWGPVVLVAHAQLGSPIV
ncbi:hypothetical protein T4E_1240 [Trichinella pseudospiralis]|uniref:Uncharacterized protein n=1 Tax=Trichinella pseudospiralis TaxID=6337 RepID=A0A0V0Y6F6_TRIPS|nr:hypothetical protein T4E_1240 [Trichinella pseudospiralis]